MPIAATPTQDAAATIRPARGRRLTMVVQPSRSPRGSPPQQCPTLDDFHLTPSFRGLTMNRIYGRGLTGQ